MFLLFFLFSSNSELDIYGLKLIVKRLKTIWKKLYFFKFSFMMNR